MRSLCGDRKKSAPFPDPGSSSTKRVDTADHRSLSSRSRWLLTLLDEMEEPVQPADRRSEPEMTGCCYVKRLRWNGNGTVETKSVHLDCFPVGLSLTSLRLAQQCRVVHLVIKLWSHGRFFRGNNAFAFKTDINATGLGFEFEVNLDVGPDVGTNVDAARTNTFFVVNSIYLFWAVYIQK